MSEAEAQLHAFDRTRHLVRYHGRDRHHPKSPRHHTAIGRQILRIFGESVEVWTDSAVKEDVAMVADDTVSTVALQTVGEWEYALAVAYVSGRLLPALPLTVDELLGVGEAFRRRSLRNHSSQVPGEGVVAAVSDMPSQMMDEFQTGTSSDYEDLPQPRRHQNIRLEAQQEMAEEAQRNHLVKLPVLAREEGDMTRWETPQADGAKETKAYS